MSSQTLSLHANQLSGTISESWQMPDALQVCQTLLVWLTIAAAKWLCRFKGVKFRVWAGDGGRMRGRGVPPGLKWPGTSQIWLAACSSPCGSLLSPPRMFQPAHRLTFSRLSATLQYLYLQNNTLSGSIPEGWRLPNGLRVSVAPPVECTLAADSCIMTAQAC